MLYGGLSRAAHLYFTCTVLEESRIRAKYAALYVAEGPEGMPVLRGKRIPVWTRSNPRP